MKSRITDQFGRAFVSLPEEVQQKTRAVRQLRDRTLPYFTNKEIDFADKERLPTNACAITYNRLLDLSKTNLCQL